MSPESVATAIWGKLVNGTHGQVMLPAAHHGTHSLLAWGAHALNCAGALQSSRRWFEAAYREGERDGDASAMGLAAVGLGGLWVHEHRTVAGAALMRARQRHALSLVDPQSTLALRLGARLAAEVDYRSGGYASILAVLDEARSVGDPVAKAEALSLAHHCVLGPEHGELRRTLALDLVAESFRTARRSDLLMGLLWQTVDLFLEGHPHAERSLGQVRDLLAGEDHLAVGFVVSAIEVMLCTRAGRFEQAEVLAAACAQRGEAAGDVDAHGWHGAQLMAIRWYQGRVAELVPILSELVHSPTLSAVDNSYFGALAVAAATAGDRRAAAGALARLRGRDLADLPRSSSWLVTMYAAVEAANLLDDVNLSDRAYALLTPFARLPMVASIGVACFGSVHHALGVACLTTGDMDRAVEHFRSAVNDNLALEHWPAAALSRSRLGQALALRAGPDDAAAAHTELAAAAKEAVALDMPVPEGVRHDPAELMVCRRLGRRWQVTLGSRSVTVEHSVGMGHLATLLAHPGREIPAADLAAGPELPGPDQRDRVSAGGPAGSAQPLLDEVARRRYRQRLSELAAEIDELEASNDLERAARSRAERDWLLSELVAATGIGGRSRQFTGNDERARIAVGKAIRRAIDRITQADPVIGRELQSTVSTGLRCSYRPE